ncbi:MAG: NACHT domain-containing protein [Parachlamydia sp.]|nr:NACHT domain-containing protein [Parachlamydia sp.]
MESPRKCPIARIMGAYNHSFFEGLQNELNQAQKPEEKKAIYERLDTVAKDVFSHFETLDLFKLEKQDNEPFNFLTLYSHFQERCAKLSPQELLHPELQKVKAIFNEIERFQASRPSLSASRSVSSSSSLVMAQNDLSPMYGNLGAHHNQPPMEEFQRCFLEALNQASQRYFHRAADALLQAVEKIPSAIGKANFLEKLNSDWVQELGDETAQLLLHKDAIRRAFEQALGRLSKASSQAKPPTCFICFSIETDVAVWLKKIFVQDLKRAGIATIFCLEDLKPGQKLDHFQQNICDTDTVIIICTPDLKKKCEERKNCLFGAPQEVALTYGRPLKGKKDDTIYLVYLKGDHPDNCPDDNFLVKLATNFTILDNRDPKKLYSYYEDIFRLIGRLRNLDDPLIEEIKQDFLKNVRAILQQGIIEKEAVEQWRPERRMAFTSQEIETLQKIYNQPIQPRSTTALGSQLQSQLRNCYNANKNISLLIPQESQEIPIEKIYTCLAIIGEKEKKEKTAESKKGLMGQDGYGIKPTHEAIFDPKEPIELEDIFSQSDASQKRILIQGSAGIGKTTLCHHIAFRWAQGAFFQEFELLFWLPLRNLNPKIETLSQYIAAECNVEESIIQLFLNDQELRKKSLIILDGADEARPEAVNPRGGALYRILEELKKFPHVMCTTRPQPVDFKPTCSLEILGFDERGINEYVRRFFSQSQYAQAQKLYEYLRQPLIKSLARIPINLEIFCSIVAAGESLKTSTLTSLYIQLTDWLYKRFRIERSGLVQDPNKVALGSGRMAQEVKPFAVALEEIAWTAMEQNTLYVSVDQIGEILNDLNLKLEVEDMVRIGPLRIEKGEAVFIHLTFQEFFAACRLARLFENNPEEAKKQLAAIKFSPRYQLVLKMTAGYLADRSKVSKKAQAAMTIFFEALFSEPRDLAISYELRLWAGCFEECEKPNAVSPKYAGFIKAALQFLHKHPSTDLKIRLLLGNNKLITEKEITQFLIDDLQNNQHIPKIIWTFIRKRQYLPDALFNAVMEKLDHLNDSEGKLFAIELWAYSLSQAENPLPAVLKHLKDCENLLFSQSNFRLLYEIATRSDYLTNEIISKLTEMLKNTETSLDAFISAAYAILNIALAVDQNLFSETILSLIISKPESLGRKWNLLYEIILRKHKLTQKALSIIISYLKKSKTDQTRSKLISVFQQLAEKQHSLPDEVVEILIKFLTDFKTSYQMKISVIHVLSELKNRNLVNNYLLPTIITILRNSTTTHLDKDYAAGTLRKLVTQGHSVTKAAMSALLTHLKIHRDMPAESVTYLPEQTLAEIVNRGQFWGKDTLDLLVSFLKDKHPTRSLSQLPIREALLKVIRSDTAWSQYVIFALASLWLNESFERQTGIISSLVLAELLKEGQMNSHTFSLANGLMFILEDGVTFQSFDRVHALSILKKFVENGYILKDAELSVMINILNNSQDSEIHYEVFVFLFEIAQSSHPCREKITDALIAFSKKDDFDCFQFFNLYLMKWATERIGNSNIILSDDVIESAIVLNLIKWGLPMSASVLRDLMIDFIDSNWKKHNPDNFKALEEIAISGTLALAEIRETCRRSPHANKILDVISKYTSALTALQAAHLCFLTGSPLFYKNGQLYSNRQANDVVYVTNSIHVGEVYKQLLDARSV